MTYIDRKYFVEGRRTAGRFGTEGGFSLSRVVEEAKSVALCLS